MKHNFYTDEDANRPTQICDTYMQVALSLCKVCGQAEGTLADECPGFDVDAAVDRIYSRSCPIESDIRTELNAAFIAGIAAVPEPQVILTAAQPAALPVIAYDVEAAIQNILAVTINGEIRSAMPAMHKELLAAARSAQPADAELQRHNDYMAGFDEGYKRAQPAQQGDAKDANLELPVISTEDRQFLHDNPNTNDLVEWVQDYARAAILTNERDKLKAELIKAHQELAQAVMNRDALELRWKTQCSLTAFAQAELEAVRADERAKVSLRGEKL